MNIADYKASVVIKTKIADYNASVVIKSKIADIMQVW